jgi:hypothetical protein
MSNDIESLDNFKEITIEPKKGKRPWLSHAIAVLVLGIASILAGIFQYGIPGIICSILAFNYYNKDQAIYLQDPIKYEKSHKLRRIGRTCAIWGIPASILGICLWVLYFYFMSELNSYSSYDSYDYYNY